MRHVLVIICLCLSFSLFAGYSNTGGKWSPERFTPTGSVQEHFDSAMTHLKAEEWDEALIDFMVISYHFRESPFYADALFYSGICYYSIGEFDFANAQLNRYLSQNGKLKHFEKTFEYKFLIAENYRKGKKKHLFGVEKLPKWSPAKADSLTLYDEIIAALPGREIAAKALFSKAEYHRNRRQYKESIDALKTLERFFPKHSLAAESFLRASEIYLEESELESQNPDLIALAQLNLVRFGKCFPTDERLKVADANILAMKEVYAKSLYETGRFYERKKKPGASAIYYRDTIQKYPETEAARKSKERLTGLKLNPKSFIASK